jgi:hypothetical protein
VIDQSLELIRDVIQSDVGNRGLRADPNENLVTACAGDFAAACHSFVKSHRPSLAIVTGFVIAHADPPAPETDGPLGAIFLARAAIATGARVVLAAEGLCVGALKAGVDACGLAGEVQIITLPLPSTTRAVDPKEYTHRFTEEAGPITHLIALERPGPSHTSSSLGLSGADNLATAMFATEVPAAHHGCYHNARGRDITPHMSPAHHLFEIRDEMPGVITIGIGDGGNEIGMGKIPWAILRRNVPLGALIACRVPTDYLIVSGVSNWGAYGLAAGMWLLKGRSGADALFDASKEKELLQLMLDRGGLVDGMTGRRVLAVDGLTFERYAEVLHRIRQLIL